MKPAPFSYLAAGSSDEVARALAAELPPRILAGGQSLVPMLNLRLAPADSLIDIGRIPELRQVAETAASIRYGAMTTHAAIEDCLVPDGSNGLMRHVAGNIAYRAIRTRGTIGGALALADPAADWVTATILLDATIHLLSATGRRQVAARAFVLGPYLTALGEGELIEAVEVPKRPGTERWGYRKVVVKTGEYAESMAMALLDPARAFVRVVLGAVDGAPIVFDSLAEALLEGQGDAALGRRVRAELVAAERDFSPGQLIMHTATVLRALRDADRA